MDCKLRERSRAALEHRLILFGRNVRLEGIFEDIEDTSRGVAELVTTSVIAFENASRDKRLDIVTSRPNRYGLGMFPRG